MNFAKRYNIEGTDAAALTKLRALSATDIVDEVFEFKQDGSAAAIPDYRKARLDVMERADEKK
ncbi:hypothetical protein ACFSQD_00835 [Flavihumibacter stibioxidans]|uniref:Uncharacterized protein n=1 Tax=Flavihumibacter stibioxidans TaxID=1834163 RepID=A0ABR7MDL9_9BACT|nr:hypothetical protein [Flavihumibacter stibioxidans]MBC6493046.1 hypothetical protein [Flavihumibacter stibioxidans]